MEKKKSIAQTKYNLPTPDELEQTLLICFALVMGVPALMMWIIVIIKFFCS